MIASCPPLDSPPALIARTETGTSEAASHIAQELKKFVEHFSGPRLQFLAEEIMFFVQNSADVIQVDYATARAAMRFAQLLPRSLPLPEVAPDPDGEISF